jgi:hypothetical protein
MPNLIAMRRTADICRASRDATQQDTPNRQFWSRGRNDLRVGAPMHTRQGRGHGFCGYAAQSAPVMASRSVSTSRAAVGLLATGGDSVMVDRTRGQAHVPAQLGLARTCLVLGLAALASGSSWSCPPRSSGDKKPGPAAATGGTGSRRSAAPGCIRSACGSSVQVGSKDRWRFSTWQKTDSTGRTSGCEQRLGSCIIRSGRPATGVLWGCVR